MSSVSPLLFWISASPTVQVFPPIVMVSSPSSFWAIVLLVAVVSSQNGFSIASKVIWYSLSHFRGSLIFGFCVPVTVICLFGLVVLFSVPPPFAHPVIFSRIVFLSAKLPFRTFSRNFTMIFFGFRCRFVTRLPAVK